MMQPEFSASGTSDTTSMLILRWVAPTLPASTPAITGYEAQYRVKDEIDWIAHDFDSSATTTQTIITALASNTDYDAQVRQSISKVQAIGPHSRSQDSRGTTYRSL